MSSLSQYVKKLAAIFGKAPWLILLVQIPEVSVDWMDRAFRETFEAKPLLGAIILFPYFILASAVSTALTGLICREAEAGNSVELKALLKTLLGRTGAVIKTGILSGAFILVGMPVLLPAIYFMTVYLFVPLMVVFDPPTPAFTLLTRSKNLARGALGKLLGFTLIFLGVGVGFFLIQGQIDIWLMETHGLPKFAGSVVDSLFSLILGVFVNLSIYGLYVWRLKAKTLTQP